MARRNKAEVVSLPQAQQVAIDAKGGESIITQPGMRPAEATGSLVQGAPTPMVSGGAAIGMPRGVISKVQGAAEGEPDAMTAAQVNAAIGTATQSLLESLGGLRADVTALRSGVIRGAASFALNERVTIIDPHDASHSTGTISMVTDQTAYGVTLDGMEDMGVHKWYTASEMILEDVATDAKPAPKKNGGGMHMLTAPAASQARPGTMGGLNMPPAARGASAVTRPSAFERWNAGLQVASDVKSNVITMYDVIGEDYWSGGGVTARSVTAKLNEIGSDTDLEVHLNSPGGDMFEGIAIYNILAMHKGKITVKVLGLAASAASVIAMAGDEVQMGPGSFIMVHDCWVLASGNRHGFAETATWLEPFDKAMADLYAKRTGKTPVETLAWMDKDGGEGTYFGVRDAIDAGLADGELGETVETSAKAAENGKVKSNLLKTELALCATMSRKEARALLSSVKAPTDSKPDAAAAPAADAVKPDADSTPATPDWLGPAAALLATFRA